MKKILNLFVAVTFSVILALDVNAQLLVPNATFDGAKYDSFIKEKPNRTRKDYVQSSSRNGSTSKWFNYAFSSANYVSGSTNPVLLPIYQDSSLIIQFSDGPGHWNLHAFSNTFDPSSDVFKVSAFNGDVALYPNTTYSVDSISFAGFYARGANFPAFTLDSTLTSIDTILISTTYDTTSVVYDSTLLSVDSTLFSTTYDTTSVTYDTISPAPNLVVDTIYAIDTLNVYDYTYNYDVDTLYNVDTLNVFDYNFNYNVVSNPTVDTLVVEVARLAANSSVFFFTATPDDGFRAVNYSSAQNALNVAQKQVIKIPLDDAFYADSTLEGYHVTTLALNSPITVAGAAQNNNQLQRQLLVSGISFKAGYTAPFGAELFDHSFYYVPFIRENTGAEPFYESYVWNMTHVAPSTVRYNLSPPPTGWNGLYIPRLAFTPGTLNESNLEIEYKVTAINNFAFVSSNLEAASGVKVSQNMPNPARDITAIDYTLPTSADVTFRVFDITGKEVYAANEGVRSEGTHRLQFNTSNLSGGIYYYSVLVNGNVASTKKMIIVE
jgi:hypothetical protein